MVFTPPQALLGLTNTWKAPYQQFNQTIAQGGGMQDGNHSDLQSVAPTPAYELYFGGAIGSVSASLFLRGNGTSPIIGCDNGAVGATFNNHTPGAFNAIFQGPVEVQSYSATAAGLLSSADPAGVAGQTGIGATTGVGNGASTGMTALAQGTGGGPASLQALGWVKVLIGTAVCWLPYFQ